ncbi:caspase family protein [Streptomyces sp. ISL-44]|uniref:caspase, EACC1-associated type n=1 Tax=Streptomyces sp. ISL-44 TaxID=2819184 RepID=UPI002034FF2C|nr:caspase family protein [Streptomyces sp. ISL-44]
MLALESSGVRVVLIGTGTHRSGSSLPDVAAVRTSVTDLARCLIERCGLPGQSLSTLLDPADPEVLDAAIREAAAQAEDVLVLYYVGHGVRSPSGELHLATRATKDLARKRAAAQALSLSEINDVLRSSCRARRILVILDCCFSGLARLQADGDSLLFTSATRSTVALAPEGARHTLFTGELIRLLNEGDPHGPPRLTLGRVTEVLHQRLAAVGRPPVVRLEGLAGQMVLTLNRAYSPPLAIAEEEPADGNESISPYLGLYAYTANDKDRFFGRERLSQELVRIAGTRMSQHGPVVVTGASGAGKSSLIHAGLLPRIVRGELGLSGSATWPHISVTPGADPFGALAVGFARPAREDAEVTHALLCSDNPGRVLDQLALGRAVVIVDQFEELFAQSPDPEIHARFARTLVALADSGKALVVIGVRSDFYGPCFDLPSLKEAASEALFVHPMTHDQLRAVITKPAEASGLVVDSELTEVILRDLDSHPAAHRRTVALPLLSHALLATWQRRTGRRLTVAHYLDVGRVEGAIAASAEDLYTRLDGTGQREARRILLDLINVTGDMSKVTRRTAVRADLTLDGQAATVLDDLIDARLVTTGRQTPAGKDAVQLSHEALLEAWPRLVEWIDEDREELVLRQSLRRSAAEWVAGEPRDDSLLYQGARLEAADDYAKMGRLSADEQTFLAASRGRQQRTTRLRRSIIAVLSVLVLIASGTAVVALQQRAAARTERNNAIFQQVVLQADSLRSTEPSLAAQLDLVAYRMQTSGYLHSKMMNSATTWLSSPMRGHQAPVLDARFSPDGRTAASGSSDGTVRLWHVTGPSRAKPLGKPLSEPYGAVMSVAFSPDSRLLVSGGADHTIHSWDVTDVSKPKYLGSLTGHQGPVASLKFSPNGKVLASAGGDKVVRLWNMTDRTRPRPLGKPLTGHSAYLVSVAFSPDGTTLASGGADKKIQLWNLTDPTHPTTLARPLTAHEDVVHALAFSPTGKTLASAGSDDTVRLWNVAEPADPKPLGDPLTGHRGTVTSLAFSPDGHTLASAAGDQTIRLWNLTDPALPRQVGAPLTGHLHGITSLAFSPDGQTLISAGHDERAMLWSNPNAVLLGHTASALDVEFSPDGKVLASGGADNTVRLWNFHDPADPKPLGRPLTGHTNRVQSVTFSPAGRILASGDHGGTVRLWHLDQERGQQVGQLAAAHAGAVMELAFSPSGKILVSAGQDGMVRLWDVTDPARLKPLGKPLTSNAEVVWSVGFAPGGRTLVSAGEDGYVRLWDVTDPAQVKPLGKPLERGSAGDHTLSTGFSPDGKILAAAGNDHIVSMWDISNPSRPRSLPPLTGHTGAIYSVEFSREVNGLVTGSEDATLRLGTFTETQHAEFLGVPLTGHDGTVYDVAVSPHDDRLASAGIDGTIRLWELGLDRNVERICQGTAGYLDHATWDHFFPKLPYSPPC